MNSLRKEARSGDGGDAERAGNQNLDGDRFNAESTDRTGTTDFRSIASRRHVSKQLDEVIARLDGAPAIELPDVGEPCPRWCSAMDREQQHYWFERFGSCPCPSARQAVAS